MSENKQVIYYGTDAKKELQRGIDRIVKAVAITLGPKGQNVIFSQEYGPANVTKDGVTVAKNIEGTTPEEDLGCSMIRSVATKTDDKSGDGTTTASILAKAIIDEAMRRISFGADSAEIAKGIQKAVDCVEEFFEIESKAIDGDKKKIRQIANISANNDKELGDLVGDAFDLAGEEGIITIQESPKSKTYIEQVEGMRFPRGFIDSHFTNNDEKTECRFKKPLILVTNHIIKSEEQILPFMEYAHSKQRPLVVIGENVVESALNSMIINRNQNKVECVAIRAPFSNDMKEDFLQDICITTGAFFFDERQGMPLSVENMPAQEGKHPAESLLGTAKNIIVTREHTTIQEGAGQQEAIDRRANQIRDFLDKSTGDLQEANLRTRLAKMVSGVIIIYVGASTEEEVQEKIYRVTDAYRATRAAIQEGYIPGGGIMYLKAQTLLDKEIQSGNYSEGLVTGLEIVKKALGQPLRQMLENANEAKDVIINEIRKSKKPNYGYNVKTGKFGNMISMGVIDPKQVARVALSNAASIAKMVITSNCVVITPSKKSGRSLF